METQAGDKNVAMNFAGRVVLVTGASAGIGAAVAQEFAARGAALSLVSLPADEGALREVAARCAPATCLLLLEDLSQDDAITRVVQQTRTRYDRLDVLVNNAGTSVRTTIQTADMESFDRVFALNVRAVYNLTRQLVPDLIKTRGNIVNISSGAATKVVLGTLPYGMSKAAVDHFTRLVALELAPKGVRVNAVCPGIVETTLVRKITGISEQEYRAWLAAAARHNPMGRVCQPGDIAAMVVHLASDVSGLVTGALVPVAGGSQLQSGFSSDVFLSQVKQ